MCTSLLLNSGFKKKTTQQRCCDKQKKTKLPHNPTTVATRAFQRALGSRSCATGEGEASQGGREGEWVSEWQRERARGGLCFRSRWFINGDLQPGSSQVKQRRQHSSAIPVGRVHSSERRRRRRGRVQSSVRIPAVGEREVRPPSWSFNDGVQYLCRSVTCWQESGRDVWEVGERMSSFLYLILPALGGYTLTSLYLLKNPLLLHKRKRVAFHSDHISHRGGKCGPPPAFRWEVCSILSLRSGWNWQRHKKTREEVRDLFALLPNCNFLLGSCKECSDCTKYVSAGQQGVCFCLCLSSLVTVSCLSVARMWREDRKHNGGIHTVGSQPLEN